MNFYRILKTSSLHVAAFSMVLFAGLASSVEAGEFIGGQVGGMVGGVVGGVTSAASGLTSEATGAVSGVTGTASSVTEDSSHTNTLGHTLGTFHGSAKVVVTGKLKLQLLNAKVGVYVLDSHGQLVRVKARIALDHILRAKAKVYVLSHGALVRVNAKVALAGIRAKAKVYVLDDKSLLRAKALIALGGTKGLKAKVGAKVGTDAVVV
jgi:hypothetical protein